MTRLDLLQHLAQTRRAESYLEIGCAYCTNVFDKVDVARKVGVDPDAKGKGHLYRGTSDAFFAEHAGPGFDLVFIDGLHEAEQALRDVNNALDILNPGGAIVVHDCNPTTEWMQEVPRPRWRLRTGQQYEKRWTGDVWKAWVQLRCRPDLDCACWDQDYGCGVVMRRENGDAFSPLQAWLGQDMVPKLAYADLEENRNRWLRLMDWEQIVEWVG